MRTLLHSHLSKGIIQFPVRTVHLLQTLECTNSCSHIHCYECTGSYSLLCTMQVLVPVTRKLVLLHKSSLTKQIQPVLQKTKPKQAKQHKQVFKKSRMTVWDHKTPKLLSVILAAQSNSILGWFGFTLLHSSWRYLIIRVLIHLISWWTCWKE